MRSLERELQTVGKGAWLICRKIFDQNIRGILRDEEAVKEISEKLPCNVGGAKRRLRAAQAIFKAGKHKEATTLAWEYYKNRI